MIRFECGDKFLGTGDRFLDGDLLPFLMEKMINYTIQCCIYDEAMIQYFKNFSRRHYK